MANKPIHTAKKPVAPVPVKKAPEPVIPKAPSKAPSQVEVSLSQAEQQDILRRILRKASGVTRHGNVATVTMPNGVKLLVTLDELGQAARWDQAE